MQFKQSISIDFRHKFVALALYIALAYSFYAFQYIIFLTWHFSSISVFNEILELDEDNLWSVRLISAFFATIFALSSSLTWLFDRPRTFSLSKNTKNLNRITAVKDFRSMNWIFHAWYSKMILVIGIMSLPQLFSGNPSDFTSNMNQILLVLVLVLSLLFLFFQMWNSFLTSYLRTGFLWMFGGLCLVLATAFTLSTFSLVEHQKLYQLIRQKNAYLTHDVEPPAIQQTWIIEDFWGINHHAYITQNETRGLQFFDQQNQHINEHEFSELIGTFNYGNPYSLNLQIHADKSVSAYKLYTTVPALQAPEGSSLFVAVRNSKAQQHNKTNGIYLIFVEAPQYSAVLPFKLNDFDSIELDGSAISKENYLNTIRKHLNENNTLHLEILIQSDMTLEKLLHAYTRCLDLMEVINLETTSDGVTLAYARSVPFRYHRVLDNFPISIGMRLEN
jgi:hypothetical protein